MEHISGAGSVVECVPAPERTSSAAKWNRNPVSVGCISTAHGFINKMEVYTGFFAPLIKFIHTIVYFFKNLFKK